MKHKVFIGCKFYEVEVGDIVYPYGIEAPIGESLLFQSREDVKVFGVVKAINTDDTVTLEIIDIKVNGVSQKPMPVIEEVIEEPIKEEIFVVTEETVEDALIDFNEYTKKELIAYIKENNLKINTTKKNKAELVRALEEL